MPENAMDYYGADGLLYCGKCHTPKDAFFAKGLVLMGKNRHPVECSCHKAEREQQEAAIKERKHLDLVRRLKADGFSDSAMLNWTFANDNGRSPQIRHAHRYVEQWQTMRAENIGLLLWGGVGTGKSFPCRVHCKRSDGAGSACSYDKLRPNPEQVEQQLFRAQ
mgnify:CR=1 FL=1